MDDELDHTQDRSRVEADDMNNVLDWLVDLEDQMWRGQSRKDAEVVAATLATDNQNGTAPRQV